MKNSVRDISEINPVSMGNMVEIPTQPQGSCIVLYIANRHFAREKNWNTKEDKGKFMIPVLHVLWLAKRQISGQRDVKQ